MYCPRCGTPNEPGDRFCSSCGAQLGPAEPAQRRSWRDRLSRLIGTTGKARLVTAATVVALAVAVVAFVALDPAADDTIPRDAYTVAADEMCIAAKRQIVLAERRLLREGDAGEVAEALLPIVAQWRSDFAALAVPEDRVEEARSLDSALRGVEFEIGGLARFADGSSRRQTLAQAKAADRAATRVEEAIAALGLGQCGRRTIGLTPE